MRVATLLSMSASTLLNRPSSVRVLHILNELRPSGAEAMLLSAKPEWDQLRLASDVLSTGQVVGPFAPLLEQAGYGVHHLHLDTSRALWTRPSLALRGMLYLFALYRLIRRGKYNVVHIHCERASFYMALAARSARVQVIRTVHGNFQFQGVARAWRGLQRGFARVLGVQMVAPGPSVASNELFRFHNPVMIIPNWIDCERFSPVSESKRRQLREDLGVSEGTFLVLSVGNCHPVKNHQLVLEILARLPDTVDWQYLHVGEEVKGAPERETARQLGIDGRCRFIGSVDDVRSLYWSSDLFVMPSQREAFGVAALEALASGTPAVLTNCPGLRDFDGYGAIAWTEPTVADTLAAVLRVHGELDQWRERAMDSVGEVRAAFDISVGARLHAKLYHDGTT